MIVFPRRNGFVNMAVVPVIVAVGGLVLHRFVRVFVAV